MLRQFWAFITGDNVGRQASAFHTGRDFPRFIYSQRMIEEINLRRRYKLLSNRNQTQIFIIDSKYGVRVACLWDISYALIVADALNSQEDPEEE